MCRQLNTTPHWPRRELSSNENLLIVFKFENKTVCNLIATRDFFGPPSGHNRRRHMACISWMKRLKIWIEKSWFYSQKNSSPTHRFNIFWSLRSCFWLINQWRKTIELKTRMLSEQTLIEDVEAWRKNSSACAPRAHYRAASQCRARTSRPIDESVKLNYNPITDFYRLQPMTFPSSRESPLKLSYKSLVI